MKVVAAILFTLFAIVLCQNPPHEPSDFSADVVINERSAHHGHRRFPGDVFEDFTNKRMRIDVDRHESYGGKIVILRLFEKQVEYHYVPNSDTCVVHAFNDTMHAGFEWLEHAKYSRECEAEHSEEKGDLWVDHGTGTHEFKRELCVSKDAKQTPLWLNFQHGDQGRHIVFKTFKSGAPDPKQFEVPELCHKY
eukprot:TRINITY_DN1421_c0_g1_i1.p1 TRINITY_DN1421_c0_g1~~TRINITY_DN1421_c0_g1_i1.p1  ORF type:complete len:193 (-),score=45.61 TRINITY_DN1421_c0_g1_i1:51-629(-)